jgi:hypothetical protein
MTKTKIAVTPLYVTTARFEFRIRKFSAKVSSTQSNKVILSFAVASTRLTSNQYETVDEYFHRNSSTVKSSFVEH